MTRPTLIHGDMLEVLAKLAETGITYDAVVCDPPYSLDSIKKRFGGKNAAPAQEGSDGRFSRLSSGFMSAEWDSDIAFKADTWRSVYRVMKPGAALVAFGGARTSHRMVCAIEDAGFEIWLGMVWCFGSGMPASHNAAKLIDKHLKTPGTYGEPKSAAHAGWIERQRMRGDNGHEGWQRPWMQDPEAVDRAARVYMPGSPEAVEWEGWGTGLKPAFEPICVARRPLEGTIAKNLLKHGVGALNIAASMVETEDGEPRYPANLLVDGSEEVENAFPIAPGQQYSVTPEHKPKAGTPIYGDAGPRPYAPVRNDMGTAARFFKALSYGDIDRIIYEPKADGDDRLGTRHPTVKPISLIRYLARLVCPPGGSILDPFAGSGTTGAAAFVEGFDCTMVELVKEHCDDINKRLDWLYGQGDLTAELKGRRKVQPKASGGLFGDPDE